MVLAGSPRVKTTVQHHSRTRGFEGLQVKTLRGLSIGEYADSKDRTEFAYWAPLIGAGLRLSNLLRS
jgi:hypothetical protein